MTPTPLYADEWVSLYHGDESEIVPGLGGVDAVVVDAPYSGRTHESNTNMVRPDRVARAVAAGWRDVERKAIPYSCWTVGHAHKRAEVWGALARGWVVSITDHVLASAFESGLAQSGRCVFSPLAYVVPGLTVRLAGDGPAQWTMQIVTARPRGKPFSVWGALPGAYVCPPGFREKGGKDIPGGKEEWIMRALVSDYTRQGDTVLDPCCGAGTTLVAARDCRRKAIGIEIDRETAELAAERLRRTAGRMVQGDLI